LAAATVSGKIYALGGANGANSTLSQNEEYDPVANAWTTRSPMALARCSLAVTAVGGKIFAIGGTDAPNLVRYPLNEEYDPAVDGWTTRTGMPTARYDVSAAAMAGKIFLLGGSDRNASYLAQNEEYDTGAASSFTALTPNTLYTFKAKARDADGNETAESPTVSTYTLAAASAPLAGTQLFSDVYPTSATVNWSSGTNAGGFNGPGATYLVQASSYPSFDAIAGSSLTANVFATVPGLTSNANYYFRVKAANSVNVWGDFFVLGFTALGAVETPTGIVFDEISTKSITASAYVASPGFSGLDLGQAGVNVAINGVYAGWRNGNVWTTRAPLLTARKNAAAAVVGGKLYVIGGFNGGAGGWRTQNEEYDPADNSWVTRSAMPTPRSETRRATSFGRKLEART
jgi:hypothetical protein